MDSARARASLRTISILQTLSDAELDQLASELTWREIKADQEIVSHLSAGDQVYFVIEGTLRTLLTTAFGRSVAIRQLRPGAHLGEIAALTGAPRSVAVVAETDGLIAECPAESFKKLMTSNAAFAAEVAASLARNVVLLTDRLFELAALEMRFRVYSELLRLARQAETTEDGVLIRNAPTHDMIAAAIGAQREAVNRELRYLVSEGVIRQSKREILIADLEKLKDMVRRRAGVTTSQLVDWGF